MPLLDIAISQPCACFRSNLLSFSSETYFRNKLVVGNDKRFAFASPFSRRPFCIPERRSKYYNLGRFEVWRGRLMIKAVATIEVPSVAHKNEGANGYPNMLRLDTDSVSSNSPAFESQSSNEDSTEVDEREKLRRMRISKANKGNTPWNKGRKHSPETLQRIKERTRLAMQNPKVKMKLINVGHSQSEETRAKIGIGVRLGWEKRREKLMLQETCHYEWQDLIAEAARKGLCGEDELQWDSYETLSKQLEQEWLQSVEERRNMPRPKGSKRAPKSAEQKRKIAEAIAAKWADPAYRDRVHFGLAKFHGTRERVERKPRIKPSGDGQTRIRSRRKKAERDNLGKYANVDKKVRKRSKGPLYKDPLANAKLEMLKNIRAQRAAVTDTKSEAISRAKLLIAEAEKAAKALELAGQSSPHVQTSLMESKMLIAEAIQFIESIENGDDPSDNSTQPALQLEEEIHANPQNGEVVNHSKVNGVHTLPESHIRADNFSFNPFYSPDLVDGNTWNSCQNGLLKTKQELDETSSTNFLSLDLNETLIQSDCSMSFADDEPNLDGSAAQTEKHLMEKLEIQSENAAAEKEVKITKKWVRGRLVEVVEET